MEISQKVLVIIPAYNEEGAVGKVVHLFLMDPLTSLLRKQRPLNF